MSVFLSRLAMEVVDHEDGGEWVLTTALLYQSDIARQTFMVPPGFRTDLASVPRMPIIYFLTGNSSTEASVIHDFLYCTKTVSRELADAVFREASAVTGVPAWRRWVMWAGVRLGGGAYYDPPLSGRDDIYLN